MKDSGSYPVPSEVASLPVSQPPTGLYCTLCNLSCTSTVVYDSHMQGKTHASKVRAANLANAGEMGNKMGCSVCNIFVTSDDALATHLAGKQHKRKSERLGEVGMELKCELCSVTATDRQGLEAHLKGKKHMKKVEGPKKKEKRFCPKCQVKVDTDEAWDLHVEGEAHKLTMAMLVTAPKVIDYNTFDFKKEEYKEEVKEERDGEGSEVVKAE